MPNAQNIAMIEAIREDMKDVSAVWVVDFRGLTVKESQALRRSIRKAGAHMTVYKNTLVRRVLAEEGYPSVDEILAGPSAFIFSAEDPVASAKALKEFAEENEKLQIKGGLMEGAALSAEEVQVVASLPSREQLMGQIAGLISGMARSLAVAINGVPTGVALATKAVADTKPAA